MFIFGVLNQKFSFKKNWPQIIKVIISFYLKLFNLFKFSFCSDKVDKIPENT